MVSVERRKERKIKNDVRSCVTFNSFCLYLSQFFLECKMFQTKVVKNNTLTFYPEIFLSQNRTVFEIKCKYMV